VPIGCKIAVFSDLTKLYICLFLFLDPKLLFIYVLQTVLVVESVGSMIKHDRKLKLLVTS
jgi:hypothetical protein